MSGAYVYEENKQKYNYLNDVYNALIVRDIQQKYNIKNIELMKASLENKIKNLHNLLKDDEKMNIYFNEILNEFNVFHNKYYSLLL